MSIALFAARGLAPGVFGLRGLDAGTASGPVGPDMTRYALVCAGLLLSILLLGWGFKRFVGSSLRRRAAKRSLAVLDVLPLGGRQKLVVVRCFDRNFLLGVGDKEVNAIAELDAEEADRSSTTDEAEPERAIERAPFRMELAEAIRATPKRRRRATESAVPGVASPETESDAPVTGWTNGEGVLG